MLLLLLVGVVTLVLAFQISVENHCDLSLVYAIAIMVLLWRSTVGWSEKYRDRYPDSPPILLS